jgi:hypothetical protein
MAVKHEWRKKEKNFYLPKNKPERIHIPSFKFFTIEGEGNPNGDHFADCLKALYAVAYAVRMSYKCNAEPEGFFEYTVYPLEGVWDLSPKGRASYDGKVDKDELVFKTMIRQPDFVDEAFAQEIIEFTKKKKPQDLLDKVKFESIAEGDCVQMLYHGSYDDEPASFAIMEAFAEQEGLKRLYKTHREIYLKDARKTPPEKLQTVLRFRVAEE